MGEATGRGRDARGGLQVGLLVFDSLVSLHPLDPARVQPPEGRGVSLFLHQAPPHLAGLLGGKLAVEVGLEFGDVEVKKLDVSRLGGGLRPGACDVVLDVAHGFSSSAAGSGSIHTPETAIGSSFGTSHSKRPLSTSTAELLILLLDKGLQDGRQLSPGPVKPCLDLRDAGIQRFGDLGVAHALVFAQHQSRPEVIRKLVDRLPHLPHRLVRLHIAGGRPKRRGVVIRHHRHARRA